MHRLHDGLSTFATGKEDSMGEHDSNYFSELLRHTTVNSKAKWIRQNNEDVPENNNIIVNVIVNISE